jgi:hypothetical protein
LISIPISITPSSQRKIQNSQNLFHRKGRQVRQERFKIL